MTGVAPSRVTGFDALRGIAALCVMIFHAAVLENGGVGIGKAYLAVDFFFLLSGYVMARTYEARFATGMRLRDFLQARLSRLYPAMALGGAIGLILLRQKMPESWTLVATTNMLLLPVLAGADTYPLNVASWSILFELIANILHQLAFHAIRAKTLMMMLIPLGLILAAVALAGDIDVGSSPRTFYAAIPRVLFSYLFGIVLWRRWRDSPGFRWPAWLTFAALPGYFSLIWMLNIRGGWADLLFIFLVSPLVLGAGLTASGGRLGARLGEISFPLYAVQFPVIELLQHRGYPMAVRLAACLLLAIGIAYLPPAARRLRSGAYGPFAPARKQASD